MADDDNDTTTSLSLIRVNSIILWSSADPCSGRIKSQGNLSSVDVGACQLDIRLLFAWSKLIAMTHK